MFKDLRIYTTWLACIAQVDCGPGWIPDKRGLYRFDKIREERAEKEKDVCHEAMQHIIDSRQGIMNTNSKHYEYLKWNRLGKRGEQRDSSTERFIASELRNDHLL
jgi:hypothetical protein